MKTLIYIGLTILITLNSCNKPVELDHNNLKALIETDLRVRENNVRLLNKAEVTINEMGNRPLDVERLEKTVAAISIRKSYELDFDLGELDKEETVDINSQSLMDFIAAFSKKFEQLNYDQKNDEKIKELEQMAHQYIKNKSLLNLLLLDLQILALESDLLDSLNFLLGDTETLGFDGRVFVYPQVDLAKSNEPFTAIITIGHDKIGKNVNLSQPEVLINNQTDTSYQLESFDTGVWLLTFIPDKTGIYSVSFTTYFTSELYPSEQYAFKGEFEVPVN